MDFELSEDQRAFRDTAREFAAREFAPQAARWDAEGHFPVDVLRRAGELGFCGLYAEPEHGGLGLPRSMPASCLKSWPPPARPPRLT